MSDDDGGDGSPPEDVDNSEAFKVLQELVEAGDVDAEAAEKAKEKFRQLHDALVDTLENDKRLMAKAKQLNMQLGEEKIRVDAVAKSAAADAATTAAGGITLPPLLAGPDASTAVDMLREDAEQAEAEATLCLDRERMLALEVSELQRQRDEFRKQLEDAEAEHAEAMAPQIRQIKAEISMLKEELHSEGKRYGDLTHQKEDMLASLDSVRAEMQAGADIRVQNQDDLFKVSGVPDKIRKQSDVVANALKGLRVQEQRLMARIKDLEAGNATLSTSLRAKQEEHTNTAATLERAKIAMEQKERSVDDIRKDLEREGLNGDQHLADQARTELDLRALNMESKRESDQLQRKLKDKDTSLKKLRKADLQAKQAQEQIPGYQASKDQLVHDKHLVDRVEKEQERVMSELKKEVEIYMNGYLKEEAVGKDKGVMFQNSYAEVAELEQEVIALKKEEHVRERTISELASQRERVSRQAAGKVAKWKEQVEYVKVKELIIIDLKKKRRETLHRLRDFQQLYDLVKNQRNKFVNLITASSQSIAEMKEKLKILANEIDILRLESVNKDRLLGKAHQEHHNSMLERDSVRGEINKGAIAFRDKQDTVDEQISEIDKLNAIINQAEKEMLRMKKQYETQVEQRNWTGITLIDRNDELCILYEKANIQEEVLKQGEIELRKREDESRMLHIELKEVQRSMEATRKTLIRVPALDEQIASLQEQLLLARRASDQLSQELESPDNKERWRRLEGKIPDKEELVAKINQLEERLNDKKEQLLEKELILEEVSSLAGRLRQQAAEGRADTLELAKRVNDYQARIRSTTRGMMATVSELSMYQASSMKLAAEREDLDGEVAAARERTAEGAAPTEDAEREWLRMERDRMQLRESKMAAAADAAEAEALPNGPGARTTAEPRPNAYIPQDARSLGVPKPYGRYAPFKPTELGSNMRHIRKPEPRDIVI